MKELSTVFIKAKEKKIYKDITEFQDVLENILKSNTDFELDWDNGAGEEWARIIKQQMGIACMLNTKIGVAFIRKNYLSNQTLAIMNQLFLVEVLNYSSEEWCLNLHVLEKRVTEISWGCESHEINVTKMSLDDLYFATV